MALPRDPSTGALGIADPRIPPSQELRARRLLERLGEPLPETRFASQELEGERVADALATLLMDAFRRSGDAEVFETLVALVRSPLEQRVRSRMRWLGPGLDPEEVLQDALVNVFRYPDRFSAERPGAFRAWSTTIVDNSIRRRLRPARGSLTIQLQSNETLCQEADTSARAPVEQAARDESSLEARRAFGMLLCCYHAAFQELNERERFVLQMVEVHGRRYAELARELEVRPEALKMVVFRARRRIQDRLSVFFSRAGASVAAVLRAAG
jgi:RNA polymerase sigma factor (sigma-70 family)